MGDSPVQPAANAGDSSAGQQPAASSGGAGAAKAPVAGGPAVAGTVIAIKVRFELDTLDGLRKVMFGLEKDMKGTDPIWTIHFQLQERAKTTDSFTNIVTLDVKVDEQALHPAAETAAKSGLTTTQAAHALGPAAEDAKGTTTGDVDTDTANQTITDTLKK